MKAARLNADLVVRKGDPARCRGGGAKVVRLQEVVKRPAAAPQPATETSAAAATPAETAGAKQAAAGDRVRLSLRLEAETHRRLKLLAAYRQESVQDILAGAIGAFVEEARPQMLSDLTSLLARGSQAKES